MKKLYSLLLASSLFFGVSTIAKAQPPAPAPIDYPSQRELNDTINGFYRSFDTGNTHFQYRVIKAPKSDNKALDKMCQIIDNRLGSFSVEATDAGYTINPQDPNLITVNFTLKLDDYGLDFHIAQADSVMLKLLENNNRLQWLIAPDDPQKYFDSPLVGLHTKKNQPISGITEHIATLVAYSAELLPVVHLHQSMAQLKAMCFAMFNFAQDYDERLAFNQQNFREKLEVYTRSQSIFTARDDPSGTMSFDINPKVLGLDDRDILFPSKTVAFYLGHNQKLDFRYDGLSPVSFMDGHVKDVTPEEAKSLRWKP